MRYCVVIYKGKRGCVFTILNAMGIVDRSKTSARPMPVRQQDGKRESKQAKREQARRARMRVLPIEQKHHRSGLVASRTEERGPRRVLLESHVNQVGEQVRVNLL